MNFAARILASCRANPQRMALCAPVWKNGVILGDERIAYGAFAERVAAWQHSLHNAGLRAGDRVILLAQPSVALYALLTALLALGMVPVLIERGMTRQRIRQSFSASHARAVIGERSVMRFWWLFPPLWRMRRFAMDGCTFGVRALKPGNAAAEFACATRAPDDHGIITFTSGSTGAPKGADRTHGSLRAQHLAIRDHWPDADDDIDCTCFPVLVLHNLCCGISTVLPHADLSAPGNAEPSRICFQLQQENITRLSAAPAFLARLAEWCIKNDASLPAIRSVVIGGATLPHALARQCKQVFPNAHCRVVYGSTEAEPIADVDVPELLTDWQAQQGHLVGRPAHAATVVVVDRHATLASEDDVQDACLPDGSIGEILVAGEHVLRAYLENPQATRESKIPRADGTVWHRTGDSGFFDGLGRLWLVGRLKDAIDLHGTPLDVFPLEKAVDAIEGVARCALVQLPAQAPVLFYAGNADETSIRLVLAAHGFHDIGLRHINSMPVDGRHNSKIDRQALRDTLKEDTRP